MVEGVVGQGGDGVRGGGWINLEEEPGRERVRDPNDTDVPSLASSEEGIYCDHSGLFRRNESVYSLSAPPLPYPPPPLLLVCLKTFSPSFVRPGITCVCRDVGDFVRTCACVGKIEGSIVCVCS